MAISFNALFLLDVVKELCDNYFKRKQTGEYEMENKTLDLGNNEQISKGVFENHDGTFTAMTYSQSKTFKSYKAAAKWFEGK